MVVVTAVVGAWVAGAVEAGASVEGAPVVGASVAGAQTTDSADSLDLSLEAALERALDSSEEVMLARTQVDMAETRVKEALAAALPQVNGSAGYTRTIDSQFGSGGGFTIPDSLKFEPDPDASVEDRLTYLEDHAENAAFGRLLFSHEFT